MQNAPARGLLAERLGVRREVVDPDLDDGSEEPLCRWVGSEAPLELLELTETSGDLSRLREISSCSASRLPQRLVPGAVVQEAERLVGVKLLFSTEAVIRSARRRQPSVLRPPKPLHRGDGVEVRKEISDGEEKRAFGGLVDKDVVDLAPTRTADSIAKMTSCGSMSYPEVSTAGEVS